MIDLNYFKPVPHRVREYEVPPSLWQHKPIPHSHSALRPLFFWGLWARACCFCRFLVLYIIIFHASNPCFIICFWFPLTVLLANQPWCYWVCIMSFLAQESITSSHSQKHTLNKEYKYHLVKPLFDAYLPFVTLLKIGLSFACLCTGK